MWDCFTRGGCLGTFIFLRIHLNIHAQTAGDLFGRRAPWNPALRIMGGVYLSTYLTANGVEAWCSVSMCVEICVCVCGVRCMEGEEGEEGEEVEEHTNTNTHTLTHTHTHKTGTRHRLQDPHGHRHQCG